MENWLQLVDRFRNQTLSKSAWTHEAHLIVALWHLLKYPDPESALCHLRAGIILHNHSIGIRNTESSGYHETITVFWVKQLNEFINEQNSREFEVLVSKIFGTPFLKKEYVLRFYRRETLKSTKARGRYIPPDI